MWIRAISTCDGMMVTIFVFLDFNLLPEELDFPDRKWFSRRNTAVSEGGGVWLAVQNKERICYLWKTEPYAKFGI